MSINTQVNPCIINSLNKESINHLKKYVREAKCADGNLVEVMCCEGGCLGGNDTIENQKKARKSLQTLLDNSDDIK